MIHCFSVAVVIFHVFIISYSTAKTIPLQMNNLYELNTAPVKKIQYNEEDLVDMSEKDTEVQSPSPRLYFDTMKTFLVRTIKSYRAVKPEFNVAMCFVRYAGLTPSERKMGRAMSSKKMEKNKEEITVKTLVRDIVHTFVLFLSDLTPEPVSIMLRMATAMWTMTKDMYKSVKQDEMGNCSLDYMSKRFWWWIGI